MAKAKKQEKATRRGHSYELTAKGRKIEAKELGPQKSVIFPLLKTPKTAAQIASAVEGKLETKQDTLRVVSFYLAQFKKDGIVTFAKEAKTPKAAKPRKAKAEPAAEQDR